MKGLSKGRYDETFAGEDDRLLAGCITPIDIKLTQSFNRVYRLLFQARI